MSLGEPLATGGAGLIVVVGAVLFLVESEIIRAVTGGRATGRFLSAVTVPLLLVVALIMLFHASIVLP